MKVQVLFAFLAAPLVSACVADGENVVREHDPEGTGGRPWTCSVLKGTYLSAGTMTGTSGDSQAELRDLMFRWAPPDERKFILLNPNVKFVRVSADAPGQLAVFALDPQKRVVAQMRLQSSDGWFCKDGRFRKEGTSPIAIEGMWGEIKWSNLIFIDHNGALVVSQKNLATRRTPFSLGFGSDVVTERVARFSTIAD